VNSIFHPTHIAPQSDSVYFELDCVNVEVGEYLQGCATRVRGSPLVPLHPTVASLASESSRRAGYLTRLFLIPLPPPQPPLSNPRVPSGYTIMKLLKSQIEQKTGAGFVTLLPEEPEDMVISTRISPGIIMLTFTPVARLQPDSTRRPNTRKSCTPSLEDI
jgi:hypothetical protein